MDDNIYASLLVVEHFDEGINGIMQSSYTELSTLVYCMAKCKQTKAKHLCIIIPEQMYVVKMAERLDTMSSMKSGGFRSQLEASCVSSHTEELSYNEAVCLWMIIYIRIYFSFMYSFLKLWLNEKTDNAISG